MIDTEQYIVSETEVFGIQHFPDVHLELTRICQQAMTIHSAHKTDIIISFLKDHMIKSAWVLDDPEIVAMITTREAGVKNLERLFDGCKQNDSFRCGLENHIEKSLLSYS